MKKNRTLLSLLFAAAFLLGGLPSLVCASTCAPAHSSMECARRCAMDAGHGMHAAKGMAAMRSNCCASASDAKITPGTLAGASQLKVGAGAPQGLIAYAVPALAPVSTVAAVGGTLSPFPSPYLWSHHPFANAPPSFV